MHYWIKIVMLEMSNYGKILMTQFNKKIQIYMKSSIIDFKLFL